MTRWEYRIRTAELSGDDAKDSQLLTNTARPAMHEDAANGWEIIAVTPAGDGAVRLFMKRLVLDFQ